MSCALDVNLLLAARGNLVPDVPRSDRAPRRRPCRKHDAAVTGK